LLLDGDAQPSNNSGADQEATAKAVLLSLVLLFALKVLDAEQFAEEVVRTIEGT